MGIENDGTERSPAGVPGRPAERGIGESTSDTAELQPAGAESRAADPLDAVQASGYGDMAAADFRAAAHAVADVMADYLAGLESRPVLPRIEPGSLRRQLPAAPPDAPEPLAAILGDYLRLIEPNVTHWQHPGFLAYFSSTASGPGILGEMLTAVLNSNVMLWRTSPAGTELEAIVVDWLRSALGLPDGYDGLLTDTASMSSLMALAAARQSAGFDVAALGLTGRPDLPRLGVYASVEAHSSIEKACMTLGLGRAGLTRIPVDDRFVLRPDALVDAIARDRAGGVRPIALVGTIGTTSTTSVDPIPTLADIAAREGLWLHVDAAYAGAAALIPDRRASFAGWERADSIVVNPHKWFFTPVDASLLLTRRMDVLRDAFSLVPEYLRTVDRDEAVRDYNEYTPQLGRRLRALKLWIQLRYFGLEGMRRRIERHIEMAQRLAGWIDADPNFERVAPAPFSTVCFRFRPPALAVGDGGAAERLDELNLRLMEAVNATGDAFISHTRLGGRFTLRAAIGNLRTEERHIERFWEIVHDSAAHLG